MAVELDVAEVVDGRDARATTGFGSEARASVESHGQAATVSVRPLPLLSLSGKPICSALLLHSDCALLLSRSPVIFLHTCTTTGRT